MVTASMTCKTIRYFVISVIILLFSSEHWHHTRRPLGYRCKCDTVCDPCRNAHPDRLRLGVHVQGIRVHTLWGDVLRIGASSMVLARGEGYQKGMEVFQKILWGPWKIFGNGLQERVPWVTNRAYTKFFIPTPTVHPLPSPQSWERKHPLPAIWSYAVSPMHQSCP